MENKERIKNLDFRKIFELLNISLKSNGVKEYLLPVPGENRFSNGSYQFSEKSNMVVAHGGERPQGDPYSFIKAYLNLTDVETFAWFKDNFGIGSDDVIKRKKHIPKEKIFENIEDFKMSEVNLGFKTFLKNRGFTEKNIEDNIERINLFAKKIGYTDCFFAGHKEPQKINNKWVEDETSSMREVLFFPLYDENRIMTGMKIRAVDGFPIYGHKTYTYKPAKYKNTGSLIYDTKALSFSEIIVSEGEIDGMILEILGFDNIIANAGGVKSNREPLKSLLAQVDSVILAYDDDVAGREGKQKIMEAFNRPIKVIDFPERKMNNGKQACDVNDFFNVGFNTYKSWDNLFKKSKESIIEIDISQEKQPLYKSRFFYHDQKRKYFDIDDFSFVTTFGLADHLGLDTKKIKEMRIDNNEIPTYRGVCYWDGGKEGHYNLLDKSVMMTPSDTPKLDKNIEFLIGNLCNFNEENIQWLMKAIHYKYHHLNDVIIPAVIFHGVGGTGKGLLMLLLSRIFGEKNTLIGLSQQSIDSTFSQYSGQKLIVEYKEVSVESAKKGKTNMNKLKTLVMEETIMVEKKGQDAVPVENLAWFFMSSNESKPVQLDPETTGNRRWTVISTGKKFGVTAEEGQCSGTTIRAAIDNDDVVKNFLAYLDYTFPGNNSIEALDNEDKRKLEDLSGTVGDKFFKWFEERYPDINKISVGEREFFLSIYRNEVRETEFNDERYYIRNFNESLSIRYDEGRPIIRGKQVRGYTISKKVSGDGFFEDDKYEENNLDIKNKR